MSKHGWEGWDQYAPFYDWENRRTLGRRDVPFWRRVASTVRGTVLGPDGRPLSGVVVQLRNDITGFKADSATTAVSRAEQLRDQQ